MTHTEINPGALLATAESAALSAGSLARRMLSEPRRISQKGHNDLVTDADVAVQEAITSTVRAQYPDHAFLTEEADPSLPIDGEIVWVIDPIDGTTNYSRGQPIFAVSVAAVERRPDLPMRPLVAAVFDPMRDELFSAAAGQGCSLNGKPASVSGVAGLGGAVLCFDWSPKPGERQAALETVARLMPHLFAVRVIGSAVLGMAWLAVGRYDVYFNHGLKPWDLAAAALLVEEAGGRVTTVGGMPYQLESPDLACLLSNGRLHPLLLPLMTDGDEAAKSA